MQAKIKKHYIDNHELIMRQNFIILAILLAIFSLVNAIPLVKRDYTFGPCSSIICAQNLLTISLDPNSPPRGGNGTLVISGTVKIRTINSGALIDASFFNAAGNKVKDPKIDDFCSKGISCPITNGGRFISAYNVAFPSTLTQYSLSVMIMNPDLTMVFCGAGNITG